MLVNSEVDKFIFKGKLSPQKGFFKQLFHKCQIVVSNNKFITCDDGSAYTRV